MTYSEDTQYKYNSAIEVIRRMLVEDGDLSLKTYQKAEELVLDENEYVAIQKRQPPGCHHNEVRIEGVQLGVVQYTCLACGYRGEVHG